MEQPGIHLIINTISYIQTKRFLIIILLFFITFNTPIWSQVKNNEKQEGISVCAEPAYRFYKLMNYLEKKAIDGFNCKGTNKTILKQNYKSNKNDRRLQEMIDSLLSMPVYDALSEISRIYNKYGITVKKGKKTYRDAFNNLPYHCVAMNAGRPSSWVEYWKKDYQSRMFTIIDYIQSNEKEIITNSIDRSQTLLPRDCNLNINVEILLAFDGNRGSFEKDQMIVMEIFNSKLYDTAFFMNVLTHELHHRFYGEWLDKKLSNKKRNNKLTTLLMLQKSFLMEGIAQQYTISNFNSQAKELLCNKILMNEIYDDWISSIRKINTSSFPKITIAKIMHREFSKGMYWLNKYCSKPVKRETEMYRPSVIYYLSYHLFNSIFEKKGLEGLSYVIENPDQLLKEYNKIYTDNMLIPRIPDDIAILWSNNLQ